MNTVNNSMEINPLIAPIMGELAQIKAMLVANSKPTQPVRISVPDYCRRENVSRQTFYNRKDRGLFKVEKVGGRNFVLTESIK